ncbi:hypothetical protein AFLA_010213 [Aspergillus flavus NRRL3357]|nr:hypothetical protein AFLA_010213 [Aspergillus flavus NRRL3357]
MAAAHFMLKDRVGRRGRGGEFVSDSSTWGTSSRCLWYDVGIGQHDPDLQHRGWALVNDALIHWCLGANTARDNHLSRLRFLGCRGDRLGLTRAKVLYIFSCAFAVKTIYVMPHERAAILLGCLLGARVLPRNSTLQRQGIDQGMLASGGLLPLTGTLAEGISGVMRLFFLRNLAEDIRSFKFCLEMFSP